MHESFNLELEKNQGNYSALSPTSLIAWASNVYPERVAVVYGERKQTWRETYTAAGGRATRSGGACRAGGLAVASARGESWSTG